jgi:hypothetical protein
MRARKGLDPPPPSPLLFVLLSTLTRNIAFPADKGRNEPSLRLPGFSYVGRKGAKRPGFLPDEAA